MSDTPKQKFRKDAYGWIGIFLVRTICSTLRMHLEGLEKYQGKDKTIFCFWHDSSFMLANFCRKRNFWIIISNSNDGDIQDRVFRKLGFQSIRGSTGRGGVRAALEAIKRLRKGGVMVVTPDGPRGPAKEVKGGVMLMAQKSGSGLVPVGITAKSKWVFEKSWDRYYVPKPFTKAAMIFGEPIYVPPKCTDEEMETLRLQLQNEINRLDQEATKLVNS